MHKIIVAFGFIFVQDAEKLKYCPFACVNGQTKEKTTWGGGRKPKWSSVK
jgi:hypothetical protein